LIKVEDPFEISHNVGRPVDKETLFDIRGEFIRASKILSAGLEGGFAAGKIPEKGFLGKICEKYVSPLSKKAPVKRWTS